MVSEMECKDAKQKLSEDLDGRLISDEKEQLEAHLEGCESCKSEKTELAQVHGVLADLAEPQIEVPDPEEAWKAIDDELGDAEPGDEDPYNEPIEIDSSGTVDIRNLVDKGSPDDEFLDEPDLASDDLFGMSSDEHLDENLPLASVAPPPVLMPVSQRPSWMVPAAIIGGVFLVGVVTLAAYLFVREGHRQKTQEKEQLARNLDRQFSEKKDPKRPRMRAAKSSMVSSANTYRAGDENPLAGLPGDSENAMEGAEPGPGEGAKEGEDPSASTTSTRRRPSGRGSGASASRRRSRWSRTRKSSRRRPSARARTSRPRGRDLETRESNSRPPTRTLDDPLNALLAGGRARGARAASREATSSLPKRLTRSQVKRVMSRANGKMKRCYQKHKKAGLLRVSVKIKGSTGRITSARVKGVFKGTPTASCALRAVRRLKFPKFQNPAQSFTYPYLLR